MRKIITVQHPQSLQHTNGMIGSWADWDLTGLGVEHAKRIGARLSWEIKSERYVMYSSDLPRTRHTAEIIAGYLSLEPIITDDLREFSLGEAVGKSKEWARANAICPLWPGTIDWPVGIDGRPFRGAESKREVWNRLSDFFSRVMPDTENNLIIVSHGGTLGVFYALWLGLTVEMLEKCDLRSDSGGVSFLRETSDGRRIINRLNDLSYMR